MTRQQHNSRFVVVVSAVAGVLTNSFGFLLSSTMVGNTSRLESVEVAVVAKNDRCQNCVVLRERWKKWDTKQNNNCCGKTLWQRHDRPCQCSGSTQVKDDSHLLVCCLLITCLLFAFGLAEEVMGECQWRLRLHRVSMMIIRAMHDAMGPAGFSMRR